MNLTIDQFIDGLERSVRELPAVLAEWEDIEVELREEYTDQLLWLLRSRSDVLARATQGNRYLELAQRIVAATCAMFQIREGIREKMGITTDRIVPYVTFVATDNPDPSLAVAV
jgi:hypothetical protein